jgi:hypothetical protein
VLTKNGFVLPGHVGGSIRGCVSYQVSGLVTNHTRSEIRHTIITL